MGIVPVGLKEKFDRYLRNNAERTDARLGDTVTDSLSTDEARSKYGAGGITTVSELDDALANSHEDDHLRLGSASFDIAATKLAIWRPWNYRTEPS